MKQIVPSFCSSSLFISLLLAIILCISPTQSIGQDVLNDICSKTDDPSFCLQTLKSDPQTATTDLLGLAGISIKLAKTTVSDTHTFVKSQLAQTTDPKLKEQYSQCNDSYDDATGNVDYANERLGAGDYGGVSAAASACVDDVSDCEDAITGAASSLPQQNKKSNEVCLMTLVIANRLLGKN